MNKHGQTLIIFVILIPLIITFMALIVDTSVMRNERQRVEDILKESINIYYKDGLIKAKKYLELNNIKDYEIKEEDSSIYVMYSSSIDSIFGNIINIKNYKIKVNLKGTNVDRIRIERVVE